MPALASAADPYEFEAALSLTGDCSTSSVDPVPDPSCPEKPPSGRFNSPRSVAVDSYGTVYVASFGANGTDGRIDIFDAEGNFITELADPHGPKSVAVDTKGTLYVFERLSGGDSEIARYVPTVYEPGADNIQYGPRTVIGSNELTTLGGVAVDTSNDHLYAVYAGGRRSIYEYDSATEGNTLLSTIDHEKVNWTQWLAIDAERRRLYASFCKDEIKECGVLVFDADSHELLKELDGSNTPEGSFRSQKGWTSIAVDEETGDFFVEDLEVTKNVYQFDENYEYLSTTQFNSFQGGAALQIAVSNGETASGADAFNRHRLFVPTFSSAGSLFAFRPPKEDPPIVDGVTVASVGDTEAELLATIDPQGGNTTYAFEYVTVAEYNESEFAKAQIGGQGSISKRSQPTQVVALLEGLSPRTAYRFRVVATNGAGKDEEEGSFATYSTAAINDSTCPNLSLRTGPSSALPDCRAYELVTPADTNGRPPEGTGFFGDRFATLQASPFGNVVSFMTEGGTLPGTEGTGGYSGDPYRATRGPSGWATVGVGPTGVQTDTPLPGSSSPDQGFSFWAGGGEGTAVIGNGNTHYVRYPDGRTELVGRGSLGTDPRAIGTLITTAGTHIVFETSSVSGSLAQQLEPNAPPMGTEVVYDRTLDEVTHVVSLLPGDVTPAAGEDATYVGASADGDGIAFEIGNTLYLRVGNAVTYEIGESVTFAGVSDGGERIFYVEAGDLYAFDVGSEKAIAFTSVGNAKVVNVAPDGTRAYFVTTNVIPKGGQNPNGAFAKAGEQNLYLSEEGKATFVATVTARDVEGEKVGSGLQVDGLGLWPEVVRARQPARDPSRLNGDGSVLLFQSRANLDDYDPNGSPQIYRYDDLADRLHCVSCIPTEVAATGGASLETFGSGQSHNKPFSAYGFVPNLSLDGRRVFFQSQEALVASDSNGVQDVYEWEEDGVGSCERTGGCVYLISSGHGAGDNYLFGHSASGDDVFFLTEDVLVPGDNDTLSIYDARVGGGFPQPPQEECMGEGCRPALTPAPALTPPAQPSPGQDNFTPPRKPRTCPKGKRKVKRNGKIRCVKKKRGNHQRKSGTSRRTAR